MSCRIKVLQVQDQNKNKKHNCTIRIKEIIEGLCERRTVGGGKCFANLDNKLAPRDGKLDHYFWLPDFLLLSVVKYSQSIHTLHGLVYVCQQ